MQIAIIGAGNVGSAIARGCVRAGHDVVISATDPAHAEGVAGTVGARAAESNAAAADGADMIVLAVPYPAVSSVAAEIADVVAGRVIIDVTNPMNADFSGLAVTDRSAAEALQESLPQALVVKAFNTVFAANQADPAVDGTQLDGFYAGDDADAKQKVADLLSAIGYRPIDTGALAAARALEHMGFLNISLNAANGWPWRSGWKLVGPTSA
ncbi:NADPH-dependent F420 reductase [Actinomadura bangladeshensis]|uniref:Prephenate dehydrogenase/arogenate dehydrogenase family protein n=1 Tax=Actinomadura bangladeshensis TaxID=453573 RepID=A0A4R4PB46_9ACTN|nr:NADPH-dependent F420 reductase [Actinomadura bangladeshensis]TDC18213.1 prephenate dehydrogenase/arogenate dehydrogenase family protein [Actinomadura bangladeshensis]